MHDRDRNGFSPLFDGLSDDFRGVRGGQALEAERDASRAIADCAEAIGMFNQALSDGRVDAAEAEQLVQEIAKLHQDLMRMQIDLRALMSSSRTRA